MAVVPPPEKSAADAARAARAAAMEATEPEARTFLREHANFLDRLAASYRAKAKRPGTRLGERLALAAPFLVDWPL